MGRRRHSIRTLFRFVRSGDDPVYLAGDFNDWNERSHPMRRKPDGTWDLVLSLPPGRYAYKFLCRGNWYNDPEAEAYEPNEWGSLHSTVIVGRRRQRT